MASGRAGSIPAFGTICLNPLAFPLLEVEFQWLVTLQRGEISLSPRCSVLT
jgi:hypothetical protein